LLAGFALRDRNLRGAAAASNPSSQPPTKPDRIVFSRVVTTRWRRYVCAAKIAAQTRKQAILGE